MGRVEKTRELVVTTENKVGMLHEVSSVIAQEGANIIAICAYGMGDKAHFMILTDDNRRAMGALKGKGYKVEEKDVVQVMLENRVAALEGMSQRLAKANIDISYIYGTVAEENTPARLVLSSNNDGKALEILK